MKKINYRVFLIILFLLLVINLSVWAIDFFELCESGTPEEIQKALQAGANINARTEYEATPLMVAALSNPNPEVIKILLQAGANINAIAEEGITPLMCAAANNPNPEVINALLQVGADPFITDNKGKRAIDYAQKGTKNYNLLAQVTSGEESDKGVQPTSEGEYFIALECLDTPTNDEVNETIKIIKNRLDLLGFSESIIRRSGFGHVLMELPNNLNPERVMNLVIVPGFLEFKNDEGDTQLTGAHLINAKSSFDQFSRSVVLIEFDKIGAKEFGEATKNNVGKVLAITLDGEEISTPVVQEPILDGKAQITGKFTIESANNLTILLKTGALPVQLKILWFETSATDKVQEFLKMDENENRKQSAFEGLFGGIATIYGETLIKYDGKIKGLAGLQLDTNPYQNVNRFGEFNQAMITAGIDHDFRGSYKAEQIILGIEDGMTIYHTSEPDDFLFQIFKEKETRRVLLIALRLQLYWDIRDKYGSLLETITALINGINTACEIRLDKDVDYGIVKQMIRGETVLVVAGENYEILYGYLNIPFLAREGEESFDLSLSHHLIVLLSPSRYSDKLDEQVNPALPNSEDLETEVSQTPTTTHPLQGSLHCSDKVGYACPSCTDALGYDNHFKGYNILTTQQDCYVKLTYNNGDYIGNQKDCEVTIKGEKWLGLEDKSGTVLAEEINRENFEFIPTNEFVERTMNFPGDHYQYDFADEGREFRLYLSRNIAEAFKAVPWQNLSVEIKNQETNKVFTYQFEEGIFPRAYAWSGGVANYGQCVWWAAKRWVEEVDSQNLFPFYPSSPEAVNVKKIESESDYQPKTFDILIDYIPGGQPGHYGFVEKVEDDLAYITQFNFIPPGEVYNYVPRTWKGKATDLYYSTNPNEEYYFKYYYRWMSTVEEAGTYALRDIGPAGGYIFYDKGTYSSGWRYLEAAPVSTEWTYKEWGSDRTFIGGTETGIGSGQSNTTIIVTWLNSHSETDRAAQVCDALIEGGYSDWFLPSKNELYLMYANLKSFGVGDFAVYSYWSSSEYSADFAWTHSFTDGAQHGHFKNLSTWVRAVRAF